MGVGGRWVAKGRQHHPLGGKQQCYVFSRAGVIKGFFLEYNFYACIVFFLFLFHFHHTLFRGLAGACINPKNFSLFVHSLVCPIIHSFLSQTWFSTSPMYTLPVIVFSA